MPSRHATTTRHHPPSNPLLQHLRIGDRIEVYWPMMRQFYQGTVAAQEKTGKHRIEYDDGDVELLRMDNEVWRFCDASAERVAVHILTSFKAVGLHAAH